MRMISWTKQPLIILFAAAIAAGCGSDSKSPGNADAGLAAKCGDKVLDTGEACDGTLLGGKTCATATSMMGSTGTLKCSATCKLDISGCSTPAGSGGAMGTGGTPVGNGGAAQGGKGGNGGKKPKTDAGTDSGSGGTSGTDASTDASKKD